MTDTDGIAAVARHFLAAVVERQEFAAVHDIFTDDHVMHDPLFPDLPHGPAGMEVRGRRYREAFPDLTFRLDDLRVAGDVVVARAVVGGRHLGVLKDHDPTGQSMMAMVFYWFRFRDGRIAETWATSSALASAEQLGVAPITWAAVQDEQGSGHR